MKNEVLTESYRFFRGFFPFFLLLNRKLLIFADVYFKPTVMKNINLYLLLLLVLAVPVLTSCEDDEEGVLPVAMRITADEFVERVDGKGWQYVESHELRSNGKYSRHDYWADLMGGAPGQYSFAGDTVTTYMYVDAYPISGYRSAKYAFDEATNRLMSDGTEVFRVLSATENELRIVRREATSAEGEAVYVYAVYRAMQPSELASLKENHPYNLDSLDEEHPRLPEQQRLTADDFRALAVGQGWKCTGAHAVELSGRYAAGVFYGGGTQPAAADYYITADSITMLTAAPGSSAPVKKTAAYAYRANGFFIEAEGMAGFKILTLDGGGMRILRRQHVPGGGTAVTLYCTYHRMTAEELALSLYGQAAPPATAAR